MNEKLERVRAHVEKHKTAYACALTGVVIAGITYAITRSRSDSSISRGIPVTAKRVPDVPELTSVNALEINRGGLVLGNSYTSLNNVSIVSSNRQGPPSWIIRDKETGEIFQSQREASLKTGIPASEISQHLNGVIDTARGKEFERLAMQAK